MEDKFLITGRVDCICGNQIISNSGKVMSRGVGLGIACWGCGTIYDSDTVFEARKENEAVVFESPGKDLKVFRMNDYDWWMDTDLESAKKNYMGHLGYHLESDCLENPKQLTDEELDKLTFHREVAGIDSKCTFREEMQIRQSINKEPVFFASTEY